MKTCDNEKQRVAVTGMGVVSPLGMGLSSFESGLWGSQSCLKPLTLFKSGIEPVPIVAQIDNLPPLPKKQGYRYSRTDIMAVLAAEEAASQAEISKKSLSDAGVIIATTVGGLGEIDETLPEDPKRYYRKGGFARASAYQKGHTANAVASCLGLSGPGLSVAVACASGALAMSIGARMILSGHAQKMFVGGSDALCPVTVSGFHALQALDSDPCRPFDVNRKGLNIGEGAAVFLLEKYEEAVHRKAPIYAVLSGWGINNDSHHTTAPLEDGSILAKSMQIALSRAGLSSEDIDYVNAHGTGTPLNDIAEIKACEKVFKNRRNKLPLSSSKSYIGHNLGAAGAVEALISILCLQADMMPPTLRLAHPIESDPIDWIVDKPKSKRLRNVLSISAGFGASNASIIFERWTGDSS